MCALQAWTSANKRIGVSAALYPAEGSIKAQGTLHEEWMQVVTGKMTARESWLTNESRWPQIP